MTFPVPWGHIAAKVWGNPTGKPVLALHGEYIPLFNSGPCYNRLAYYGTQACSDFVGIRLLLLMYSKCWKQTSACTSENTHNIIYHLSTVSMRSR